MSRKYRWRKKKVLVTGGCGFIGSHLAERLSRSGHLVTVFDKYYFDSRVGHLEYSDQRDRIKIVLGDIRDLDSIENLGYDFDQIYHLAALISIPYSYVTPHGYLETNVMGTNNLLAFARKNRNLKSIVLTSTSEVYGTPSVEYISESQLVNAQSPYAASKIAADQLALSYYRCFDLPVRIIRPFNTYGPRQSQRAVIPTIITQLLAGTSLKLGRLDVTRDFTFVEDTAEAFEVLGNIDDINGEIINVGYGKEISIKDLVALIGSILNLKPTIEDDLHRMRPDASEVLRLNACTDKMTSITGWSPSIGLVEGLTRTIDYFKSHGVSAPAVVYRY